MNRSRQGHCKERGLEGGFQLTSIFPSPARAVLLCSDKDIVPVGVELGILPYHRLKSFDTAALSYPRSLRGDASASLCGQIKWLWSGFN